MAKWVIFMFVVAALLAGAAHQAAAAGRVLPAAGDVNGLITDEKTINYGGVGTYGGIGNNGIPFGGVAGGMGTGGLGAGSGFNGIGGIIGTGPDGNIIGVGGTIPGNVGTIGGVGAGGAGGALPSP